MLPIGVAPLVVKPDLREQDRLLKAVHPHLAPALADEFRVRRVGREGHQHRPPYQVLVQEAATHVMGIIGVTVVR